MFYIKVTGIKHRTPFCTPSTPVVGVKRTFLLKVVMLHIKLNEKNVEQHNRNVFYFMHYPDLGKKVRHWKYADKYILIELSMLTVKYWLYCIIDRL